MSQALESKKSNCKNCYKCIRACPVKSIRFSGDQAQIVEEECILCGKCYTVCPQNAKTIRSDISKAEALLHSGAPVFASVAPSFVARFENISFTAMRKALSALGFAEAEETAVGATIVKREYEKLIEKREQNIIISSCCHSVNLLIQKYYSGALGYLAKVKSPMQAHCDLIKKTHPEAKTVFIGPCISKKDEAEAYPGIVDCVLTFDELSEMLAKNNISLEDIPDNNEKSLARLFPTSGGILKTMDCADEEYSYMVVDGLENCINTLKDIEAGGLKNCFIEMSACAGSCIGGPVMEKRKASPVRDYLAVSRYAGKEDFEVTQPDSAEIVKNLPYIGIRRQMPGSSAIEEILHKMGKTNPEDELNCGSCGYNTCREKAVAVYLGKADLSMCLPFLKDKAESFSDNIINNTPNGIIVLNENLEVQQINKAAAGIMNIKNPLDILGDQVIRILDPSIFIDVLQTGRNIHDKRVYLAEYKKYVEQTVIYDKSYNILMSIMRDITDEEAVRSKKETLSRQTIEITDRVIEKQMRVVQEIASLLGETTAETKIALTNLKESLSDE